ncbi:MAG: EamA family transporter [Rhodospirillales bacterium]|nr:EamA family transporter [Rhodospirillales bacterium]MBO6786679.1 EamA family transporter [Rhodospirillales bacterium]
MDSTQSHKGVEYALLMLLALLWGSSYMFLKIGVETIPPVTLIALRVTIAAILLSVIVLWRGERLPAEPRLLLQLLLQAFLNSFGAWTILAWGQQYVESSLATVLNSTSPLWVFLITFFVTRHESTSTRRLLGASLGIGGVILIVGTDALQGLGQAVGAQLAVLFAAMLYGCAAIYGKRFSSLSPTVTAASAMILSAMVMVPLSLVVDRPWTLTPSASSLMAAVALGVFCTGVALMIYFRLLRTLGSMGAASQGYLRTGVGVVLGVVVLGETITPIMGAGIAAAVTGVVLINLPKRRTPEK